MVYRIFSDIAAIVENAITLSSAMAFNEENNQYIVTVILKG